ncbi:D-beta-hydroxybutyrate dehydrogenase, mitochondrial-like [Nerophis ophidion]|uniref:D-beta-hydroxybutyrate dehydrogenase, mitochondrial-like n=1 Tax=Nerophis ophidion TaxID=159077 RepID=UPI002ADF721F|nr:D-beta-hydroxybutyrate dehydrogenase, mitochondrial-like [Nerophis ophidion]
MFACEKDVVVSPGRVVNMSSSDARMGDVMRSPDCVSKYGVEAFSDCLRHEMKPWGVKVSLVEPGNFTAAAGLLTRHAAPDKLWAEAPAGVREDYGRVHFQRRAAPVRSFRGGGRTDVGPVVQDVVDAIRSKHPYTRYNPMEPRCWLRMQLMTHLPAALSDLLYF